jgi:hypothetical protein
MTVTKQDPVLWLHDGGVPLYYTDAVPSARPVGGDVEPFTDDFLYVYIAHAGGNPDSPWLSQWWAGWAIGEATEFRRVKWPNAAYDADGDLISGSSSDAFTGGSDRFDVPLFNWASNFDALFGNPHRMRIRLNPLVGYHKNDIKIRLANMWYDNAGDIYGNYDAPDDPLTSFTVSAFRSSETYPAIPEDAEVFSGTAPFVELATNLTAVTSAHNICNIHWNNSTDSITIS